MLTPRSFAFALAASTLLTAGAVGASSFPVLVGHGTATIDGFESPGEWEHGNRWLFTVESPLGTSLPGAVRFMDDGVNMYWNIVIGPSEADQLFAAVNLDNDGDGVCETGDDFLFFYGGTAFQDCYQDLDCSGVNGDDLDGGTADGSAAGTVSGTGFFFEVSHPLDSADDAHDISLGAHDPFGIRIDMSLCVAIQGNCTANQPLPSEVFSSGTVRIGGIFLDGFETGDPEEWSAAVTGAP